ncbi:LexA family protein [Amedibacterium intestinale]|uniref:HTH cro/C1-type domain-containing protein n=1 Tax=Amedibacterium intestinale TaxID=2583452 RepID=A0A6N4TH07_9FIRM|nr:S24 family peptidase [Amedibacterium intestinale]RHO15684.1 helix-turn-helix domain-containing protein [Eubacterium sp. AM18-26]RHO20961.1 helix-turn-helix domain-containing protein [Eubacterium sp. AM18-10LB-B]BBK22280.1 hypothetical protein Aargi30884_11830 [Amedibacterium intestinale]
MELHEIIRDYKNRFHLSNIALAERFQVTPNTVARWLRGEVKSVQDETAYNISQILGFDIQKVLSGDAVTMKRPILGVAKAGYDMFLEENYLGEESVSMEEYRKGDYFLKVEGNSMINAGIVHGGLVYVKQCSSVNNGDIAVVSLNDEVTIKRFIKLKDEIVLSAENPEVEDRHFTVKQAKDTSLKILGKVLFSKNYV